ncbi:hypothetical protein [Myroides injenensis]|uniref:hypothetical protein n=1 Tax=Myroides injenensis TaxID=1183151 RepID=UPI000289396C|nr:hypothetical protein [Myroides injenensis]
MKYLLLLLFLTSISFAQNRESILNYRNIIRIDNINTPEEQSTFLIKKKQLKSELLSYYCDYALPKIKKIELIKNNNNYYLKSTFKNDVLISKLHLVTNPRSEAIFAVIDTEACLIAKDKQDYYLSNKANESKNTHEHCTMISSN